VNRELQHDYRGTGAVTGGAACIGAVASRDQEGRQLRQDDRRSAHDNRGDPRRLDEAVVLPLAHQYKWRATTMPRVASMSAINKGSSSPINNNHPMSLIYVTRLTSPPWALHEYAVVAERSDTIRPYRANAAIK
jgi:hypothetical protein